jgi:hypothetical protein
LRPDATPSEGDPDENDSRKPEECREGDSQRAQGQVSGHQVLSSILGRGSSIDIGWTDGPTDEQVAAVTGKYALGHFDGMTDSYHYDPTLVVAEDGEIMKLGGASYIFNNRRLSDEARATCFAACESYWADWASLADYERDERVYRILRKSDLRGVKAAKLQYADNAGESILVAA